MGVTGPCRLRLRGYERFQSNAIWDHQGAAVLLDEMLLFEAGEEAADGFARRADHLADLFVGQGQLHLGGVYGRSVLVEPSHHQSSQLFGGGVGKDQVTDFAAGAGVILADVLGDPQRKLAVLAHEAQQIDIVAGN